MEQKEIKRGKGEKYENRENQREKEMKREKNFK